MAFDRPTKEELATAVKEFLEDKLLPELKGHLNFNTRVSINVLRILERELAQGEEISRQATQRLQALMQTDETDIKKLNEQLCEEIDKSKFTYKDEKLVEHLWLTTLDKLSVDNPRYVSYQEEISNS